MDELAAPRQALELSETRQREARQDIAQKEKEPARLRTDLWQLQARCCPDIAPNCTSPLKNDFKVGEEQWHQMESLREPREIGLMAWERWVRSDGGVGRKDWQTEG